MRIFELETNFFFFNQKKEKRLLRILSFNFLSFFIIQKKKINLFFIYIFEIEVNFEMDSSFYFQMMIIKKKINVILSYFMALFN